MSRYARTFVKPGPKPRPIQDRFWHLFLGTMADNSLDRDLKGRNPSVVLSLEAVQAIRALYRRGGVVQKDLAAWFGVGRSNVQAIVSGKSWRRATARV